MGYMIAPNVVIVKFFNFGARILWHGDWIWKGKKNCNKDGSISCLQLKLELNMFSYIVVFSSINLKRSI
jgi:hypothetical protein